MLWRLTAVHSLDLCVPHGCVFGFVGRNGAGKTTTIGMLVGLLRPSSGHAWLLGHDIAADLPVVLRRTGVLLDRRLFIRI